MLNVFEKSYLKTKLSSGITALYSNIIVDQIGSGLVGIFVPIFLWQQFGSLNLVLLYYLIIYTAYLFLVFVGAKIMSLIGLKTAMILSIPFKILIFGGFYCLSLGYPVLIFTALIIAATEIRLMLFWIPYHTDFAKFTNKRSRGKVIAFLSSISSLVSIGIPFLAGWIIATQGFNVLFIIAMILVGASIVPLFLVTPTFEKFTFSFGQTWKALLQKKNRRMVLARIADGAENSVGTIIWPIFMFQLLQGDFLAVGAISSLIVLATVVLRLVIGSFTDKMNKRKLLRWGSMAYAIGWIVKVFVATGFQIFIASTYHNFASIVMRTPFDALNYEKAADSGHYVDEMTVLREMALCIGRVICIVALFALLSVVGLHWAFVLAAVAALFINLF